MLYVSWEFFSNPGLGVIPANIKSLKPIWFQHLSSFIPPSTSKQGGPWFGRAHNLSHPSLLNWSGHRWDTKPHQKTVSKERGSRRRGCMYSYDLFTLLHGRNQHNIVKKNFLTGKSFVISHRFYFFFLLATFSNHVLILISGIFFLLMGPEDITFHSY